jgi:hypothetical protein
MARFLPPALGTCPSACFIVYSPCDIATLLLISYGTMIGGFLDQVHQPFRVTIGFPLQSLYELEHFARTAYAPGIHLENRSAIYQFDTH